jgi:DNA polymerase
MTTNLVLDPRQRAMLAEMGVRVWLPQTQLAVVSTSVAAEPVVVAVPVRREPPLRLPVLSSPPATSGPAAARYVIGNLPANAQTFEYVLLGDPCTGDAEKLLASMVRSLGAKVFVAQMVPSQNESESLLEQLATMPSKVIVLLGPHPTKALLGEASQAAPFGKLRGTLHALDGLGSKAVVTYSAQQAVKTPGLKAQVWFDLKLAMKASK